MVGILPLTQDGMSIESQSCYNGSYYFVLCKWIWISRVWYRLDKSCFVSDVQQTLKSAPLACGYLTSVMVPIKRLKILSWPSYLDIWNQYWTNHCLHIELGPWFQLICYLDRNSLMYHLHITFKLFKMVSWFTVKSLENEQGWNVEEIFQSKLHYNLTRSIP